MGAIAKFIAVPRWPDTPADFIGDYLMRVEAFYNIGSRLVKFHAAPGTMIMRGLRLDSPKYKPVFEEIAARKMAIMTHIGDPDTWYHGKYAADAKFGTRDDHYKMWESVMAQYPDVPWVGAHMGGNPEDLGRLQGLLDRYPNLMLDCSATRWMAREISARRDAARDFFIHNRSRILFGSDQVSTDDRGFDFLASRFWVHRKLWETAYIGGNPILDPDLPADQQPMLRGLALPDVVLQKLYHDNATKFLKRIGMGFPGGCGPPLPLSHQKIRPPRRNACDSPSAKPVHGQSGSRPGIGSAPNPPTFPIHFSFIILITSFPPTI